MDSDYMKKCQAELDKLNEISTFDDATKKKDGDGRSMLEVMREKRQAAERQIEEAKSKQGGPESVEQRMARLRRQRDLLKEQQNKKRAEELEEFNKNMADNTAANKPNLFDEFKQMDANKKAPGVDAELERRRMIYKNLRKELDKDEQIAKE